MSDKELGIQPLIGKYYGTKIYTDYGELTIWGATYNAMRPSDRQLAEYGMTPEEWEVADQEIKWDITCDSHYETQGDYLLARRIAEAIANVEVDHEW